MSETDKAKRMKEQVELLKQKYLKNNGGRGLVSSTVTTSKIIKNQFADKQVKQADKKQEKEKENDADKSAKLQQSKIVQSLPDKKQQWSVRNIMEQQPAIQSQTDKKQEKKQFFELEFNQIDPFCIKAYSFKKNRNSSMENLQADAQFTSINQREEDPNSSRQHRNVMRMINIGEACHKWKKSRYEAIQYLMFDAQALLNDEKKTQKLILTSKNPKFPGIVQNLAMQFIFKNSHPLNDAQKDVVYEMAVSYFSPSPKILSDVLLLSIIKIGVRCLKIYSDQILSKIEYYFQRILIFREDYLLNQEVQNFVSFLNEKVENSRREGLEIPIKWYLWILLLRPLDPFLHQLLLASKFDNVTDLFIVFCILEPGDNNNSLSLLYLRCLDELTPTFSQYRIIEDVIENFKKMKVPEPLYKHVKSLKLKLIRYADSSGMLRKPSEQEKGFMNFLNDKMGKLKDKLDSSMMSKSKLQVYFDQVLGQYRTSN